MENAVKVKHSNRIRTSRGDRVYYFINNILLGIFFLITLIPLINVVASSFSSAFAVNWTVIRLCSSIPASGGLMATPSFTPSLEPPST